jgi:peptidoglycan/LPS O-acetylase OafA/YrhL
MTDVAVPFVAPTRVPTNPQRQATPTGKNEIGAITGLRGLAALMVAIYHINPELIAHQGVGIGVAVGKGYLWVDLFFVLSGFVLALNYGHLFADGWSAPRWRDFLIRRMARVYPLYCVVVLAGFAGWLMATHAAHAAHLLPRPPLRHPMLDATVNLLMIQSWGIGPSIDGTAWSLSTEWAAYLLFPFLAALTLFSSPRVAAGVGLIAVASAVGTAAMTSGDGAYHSGPLDAYDGSTLEPILRCLAGFMLGLLMFRLAQSERVLGRAASDAVVGTVMLLLLVGLAIGVHDLLIYPLFAVLVLGLYGNRGLCGRALAWRPLYWLGAVSYSLYLLHPFLVLPRRGMDAALQAWLPAAWAYAITSIATYALLFVASDASFRLIEQPGRRWLSRFATLRGTARA